MMTSRALVASSSQCHLLARHILTSSLISTGHCTSHAWIYLMQVQLRQGRDRQICNFRCALVQLMTGQESLPCCNMISVPRMHSPNNFIDFSDYGTRLAAPGVMVRTGKADERLQRAPPQVFAAAAATTITRRHAGRMHQVISPLYVPRWHGCLPPPPPKPDGIQWHICGRRRCILFPEDPG
jgi:hypothetical protein